MVNIITIRPTECDRKPLYLKLTLRIGEQKGALLNRVLESA